MSVLEKIIDTLKSSSQQIRLLESQAHEMLHVSKDTSAYKEIMTKKALELVSLPDHIASDLELLDPKLAKLIKSQVGSFSFSAGKSIDINSVFYMSALLYPADYADGDSNDLENFIAKLENYL